MGLSSISLTSFQRIASPFVGRSNLHPVVGVKSIRTRFYARFNSREAAKGAQTPRVSGRLLSQQGDEFIPGWYYINKWV